MRTDMHDRHYRLVFAYVNVVIVVLNDCKKPDFSDLRQAQLRIEKRRIKSTFTQIEKEAHGIQQRTRLMSLLREDEFIASLKLQMADTSQASTHAVSGEP